MSDGILLLLMPFLLGASLFLLAWAVGLLLTDLVNWFAS
jgi:hypothetical protein